MDFQPGYTMWPVMVMITIFNIKVDMTSLTNFTLNIECSQP